VSGSFLEARARATLACQLLSAHLELTYRCNARCAHCYQSIRSAEGELDVSAWISAVEQVREAGALFASISGGEPLLSPHFWPVAERARQLGMGIRVFTNGLLLSRVCVDRLAQLRPASVEVSIFSLRPPAHDAVTGVPGSLGKTLRGLFRLRDAGVVTVLKCPLLAASASDHDLVLRLGERLGAGVVFDPLISPRTDGHPGPLRCRGEDSTLQALLADPAMTRSRGLTSPIPADLPTCTMGRNQAVISPRGEVFSCPLHRVSAGSLQEASLRQIWTQSPVFQKLRTRRFGQLSVCGTCPRSGYCRRCSAIALLEDGDLDGPSSRACHIAELVERAHGVPAPKNAPVPASCALPIIPPEG